MAERNHHIILRQVFDLVFPPGGGAFATQQQIGQFAREKLAPQLEELLDRFAPSDELIQIDKLEIDIGHVIFQPSGEAISRAILQAVEEKLLSLITYSSAETKRIPIVAHRFGQWLFYLENGHLPWQVAPSEGESLHLAVLKQLSTDTAAVAQFRQLAGRHSPAIERLVMQHPEPFLVKLLAAITARRQERMPAFQREVRRLLAAMAVFQKKEDVLSERQCYRMFWEWAIRQAVMEKTANREDSDLVLGFLENWISNTSKTFPGGEIALRTALTETVRTGTRFPLLSGMVQWTPPRSRQAQPPSPVPQKAGAVKNEGDGPTNSDSRALREDPAVVSPKETDSAPEQEPGQPPGHHDRLMDSEAGQTEGADSSPEISQKKDGTERPPTTASMGEIADNNDQDSPEPLPGQSGETPLKKTDSPDYPEGSAWYVRHAGVVLLHPFFLPYFKKCGLLKNGAYVDEAARQRAVHLVHYLASGETGVAEHDLVLPKFLCGVPFGVPIEREVHLTEEEKSEGSNLLRSVIEHWGRLGNSSPDGLRQGFLQRDGKLEKRQQGWYLVVEQAGIDVLLDFLPWNLRMVKLPWMPDLLRVEWG